jgi:hypothetical protein
MALTIVGLALAGFLYILLNPATVKASNERANYNMDRIRQETDLVF